MANKHNEKMLKFMCSKRNLNEKKDEISLYIHWLGKIKKL